MENELARNGRVVIVGSINVDYVLSAKCRPSPGETVSDAELTIHPGGKGANQAVAAALSGARVDLIARVGADSMGSSRVAELQGDDVGTEHVLTTPGVATGLAYTPVGGDILFVEASRMHGKGRMTITGQIGRVMGESAQAALSLLKSRSDRFNLDPASFSKSDIHIHVPAGAVPKDGPSAGVSMFTALVSLFTGQAVRPDVAMTGEITLRGLVLPIGGVKEKLIAAHRAGIKLALLPKRNEKDVMEIKPPLKGMAVEYVNNVDELIRIAIPSLAPTTKPETKPPARTTTAAAQPGKLSSIRKNRPNPPMIPPGNA